MKNKVLIKLYVPKLNLNFDMFIPVNEYVWKVNKLIVNSINDMTSDKLDLNEDYYLINVQTGNIYQNNQIIINTDIRHSSSLVLIDNNKRNYSEGLRTIVKPQVMQFK